ncbi:hypothetical protein [Spirosoma areae]
MKYLSLAVATFLTIQGINAQNPFKALKELTSQTAQAVSGSVAKNKLNLRGPVQPVNPSYATYKTYSISSTVSPGLEASLKNRKLPYSKSAIQEMFVIDGLKKIDNGDFKVLYNLTRFELVNDEDYVQDSYQRAPAYYIGMESNLEIKDKNGQVIYKRYTTPKLNMYVVDPEMTYDQLANRILSSNFQSLIAEFDAFYLYGPVLNDLRYFSVEKGRKSKSPFNAEEFNQSVQVLPTLVDVDRENWSGLFGEAQTYWKTLVNYTDPKDDDLQKDVRFAANYNLAATYLLLGQEQEATKYIATIKDNESSFLGIRAHAPFVKESVERIGAYRTSTDKAATLEPIAAEPDLAPYKKASTVFRYAELEGEAEEDDAKIFKGKIRFIGDFPEMIDYRTKKTSSGLGQMLGQIGSDNSSVRIFIEGEKKPVKTSLKKLTRVKDSQGHNYIVGKTGRAASAISNDNMNNTKRYALFEEVKAGQKLALYHEFFPQDDYVLKKTTTEDFYSPPVFLGRRKSLRAFFADCPAMIEKIDKGAYDYERKEVYQQMFDDYTNACGNK